MFDNKSISIPCPGCGQKTSKTIAWIKANDNFICDGCGRPITIKAEELLSGLEEAKKAIADFKRNLRGIGKRR
ncbi:hypothetical protein [Rhizobium mayense]|uniref:hypothetical protein n=1 Tax=Rhizobium mayense TaxID=1312184 RepID=UPI00398C805E